MKKIDIAKELSTNAYPGRGIVIGKSDDGKKAAMAYFIMGRSVFQDISDFLRVFLDAPVNMCYAFQKK